MVGRGAGGEWRDVEKRNAEKNPDLKEPRGAGSEDPTPLRRERSYFFFFATFFLAAFLTGFLATFFFATFFLTAIRSHPAFRANALAR